MNLARVGWSLGLSAALVWGLAACDQQRITKLEEGLSTEADVRQQFGDPVTIVQNADGSKVMEYPRQPEGQTNYFITIGPDGKMSSLRQVLTPANFAKITPGMSKDEVLKILGRPAKTMPFKLKNEEVWDWRYVDGQRKLEFSVHFNLTDGKVMSTESHDDPRESQGGPSR